MVMACLTSGESKATEPFHSPIHFSGPTTPSRVFSNNSADAQMPESPTHSGVMPAAFSLSAAWKNSSKLRLEPTLMPC